MSKRGEGTEASLESDAPFHLHQRLATSGARAVLPVEIDGELHLIVPQLAYDVEGTEPHMNGGDSNTDALIFRWEDGRFTEQGRLPVPGGEDALVFTIEDQTFLATASVRTGSGPYDLNAHCVIFRREPEGWSRFQDVPSFAGKQWHHFTIGDRHFLALAQGVTVPTATPQGPRSSRIFEWRGGRFELFQEIEDGCWGYNWADVAIDGSTYLAYADHTAPSRLLRWDGTQFVEHQRFSDRGGRAFAFFEQDGRHWLAYAAIDGDSYLYVWDGNSFVVHQLLGGPGGREYEIIRRPEELYLVRICFIEGDPHHPRTDLRSQLYRWTGAGFDPILSFPTFGGTDAAAFEVDGQLFLAVSDSLTAGVRFRQDSAIYRVDL
jgi:hypothetical protein